MRIAILTPVISAYHNARFRGLQEMGLDATIVTTKNEGHFKEFLVDPKICSYAVASLFASKANYCEALVKRTLPLTVTACLERINPDAIVASGWYGPESFIALEYGRGRHIPTLVMSESQVDDAPRSVLRETLKKRVVRQFDAALVGGWPHADYVTSLGIPRERIHLGYNAVDNEYFEREANLMRAQESIIRMHHGLPERYILASARFIEKKNLPQLIIAYANALSRLGELPDLVILGDGPERSAIENAIKASNVRSQVHLPGFRGYEVLPAFYGLAEAFLHVSKSEQWGLVINEAMASGVPVIASRACGAARTVIEDGVSGVLTGVDVGSISDAIVRLFRMTPEQRQQMGSEGIRAIHDWGPERFRTGMLAAVESAQAAPRRGRIAPWDRAILSRLQRRTIEVVS